MKPKKRAMPTIKLMTSPDSPKVILNFLQAQRTGVLATTDPVNKPHAAVVYYYVNSNFEITFVTKSHTKKYENIQRNNRVMLVAYDEFTQTTVQVSGSSEEIKNIEETQDAIAKMLTSAALTSDAGDPPISKLYAGDYVAFRIIPELIHMAIFLRPDPGGYDIFETLQFADKK